MKHRIHLALTLSIVAVAGMALRPAWANPGLLHKHGARSVGIPVILPGQSAAGVAPGSNGAVVISGGVAGPVEIGAEGLPVGGVFLEGGPAVDPGQLPICVMPAPDGRGPGHHGGPKFFNKIHPGASGGDPGMIEPGWIAVDGVGAMPTVVSTMVLPEAAAMDAGRPGFVQLPSHAAMIAPAAASASDLPNGAGRALARGLPNRAVGVRADSVAAVGQHGRGPATRSSTPEGVAVSGNEGRGRVLQAGGHATDRAGEEPVHDRRARNASAPGQAVVPPGASVAPRWRDRLRFAWPTLE